MTPIEQWMERYNLAFEAAGRGYWFVDEYIWNEIIPRMGYP
jgi:hypothetical protein